MNPDGVILVLVEAEDRTYGDDIARDCVDEDTKTGAGGGGGAVGRTNDCVDRENKD